MENLKKDLKYIKEKLKAITSQQGLANRQEANDNRKGIVIIITKKKKNRKRKNQKITILNLTNTRKHKQKKKDSFQLQEMKTIKEKT